jgi:hypothetical protein
MRASLLLAVLLAAGAGQAAVPFFGPLPSGVAVETPADVCVAQAVVAAPMFDHVHFTGTACDVDVGFTFYFKALSGASLDWTITSAEGVSHCHVADQLVCDAQTVPTVVGELVSFDVRVADGGPVGTVGFQGVTSLLI